MILIEDTEVRYSRVELAKARARTNDSESDR
jgi:hypothetical protein